MLRLVHPRALAATAGGLDRLLGPALVATLALLLAGWSLPLMTINRFIWLDDRVSLLETARAMWQAQEWLLFAVVALFAILLPLVKLAAAIWLWYRGDARTTVLRRGLALLDLIGRWAMLDVFVAALLVAAIKASLISEVTLHAGLYVFTAAVVLSIALIQRLRSLARQVAGESA